MNHKISVVIRTYNEQKHIEEVLKSLELQTYRDFEIIILDSESTDNTIQIASKYDVRIEKIKKKDFNYSYASNKCIDLSMGDIICFLSGHSVPVKEDYLERLNQVFQNPKVGACYGDVVALPDGSITEKIFNKLGYIKNRVKGIGNEMQFETKIHPGIFSCSNASARTYLLKKHPFAIELGQGGEDVEVAYQIIKEGYYIARVPQLLVMHSHGKGLWKFIKEYSSWQKMWKEAQRYIQSKEG